MVWIIGDDGKVAPRPIQTAEWVGRDWVVLDGLKDGDQVVVDNLIKIRPGQPWSPRPAMASRAAAVKAAALQVAALQAAAEGAGQQAAIRAAARAVAGRAPRRRTPRRTRATNDVPNFIERPIFAAVIAIVIVLAGLLAADPTGRAVPGDRAADGDDHRHVPRRQRRDAFAHRRRADRGAALRRREPDLFQLDRIVERQLQITATFESGTDVDTAMFEVNNRVQLALPRLPDEVRRNGVIVQKRSTDILLVVVAAHPPNRRATRCSCRTTPRSTSSTSSSASPA